MMLNIFLKIYAEVSLGKYTASIKLLILSSSTNQTFMTASLEDLCLNIKQVTGFLVSSFALPRAASKHV